MGRVGYLYNIAGKWKGSFNLFLFFIFLDRHKLNRTHKNIFLYQFFFTGALNKLKVQHQEDPNSTTLVANKPFLLRSLFTVGALARHFDFDLEEFKGTNKVG